MEFLNHPFITLVKSSDWTHKFNPATPVKGERKLKKKGARSRQHFDSFYSLEIPRLRELSCFNFIFSCYYDLFPFDSVAPFWAHFFPTRGRQPPYSFFSVLLYSVNHNNFVFLGSALCGRQPPCLSRENFNFCNCVFYFK